MPYISGFARALQDMIAGQVCNLCQKAHERQGATDPLLLGERAEHLSSSASRRDCGEGWTAL